MHLRILAVAFAALVLSSVAFAQIDSFQVNYAANLNIGDSVVNITNAGSLAGTDPAGRICVNIYAFDPAEEMISCCACAVTPNGLNSLSDHSDLISNVLTPGVPTAIVIKLVATPAVTGVTCNAGNGGAPFTAFAPGMRAWGTTLHANATTAGYQVTETPFLPAVLSATENAKLTSYCNFIQLVGSSFGICKSCRTGGLGATTK